jgi:hypothetical protein
MSIKALHGATVAILLLSFGGCGGSPPELAAQQLNHDAKANGLPFRWKAEKFPGGTSLRMVMVDLPSGATRADDLLQRNILTQIKKVELSKHRSAPAVDEVRLMPDGREVWVLNNPTQGVAYVVTLQRAPQGGTNFRITGPIIFQRS